MSPHATALVLRVVGRLLLGAGVVVLLFAGFQLWGTGVAESRAQHNLEDDFAERVAKLRAERAGTLRDLDGSTASGGSGTSNTALGSAASASTLPKELVDLIYPSAGEPVARIVIPAIKVDKVVVEGIEVDDLRKGPGHFPDTPLPGQAGNAAIAGHRTTYGAPFGNLDQLEPGDEIRVSTVLGEAVYQVAGTRIVQPEQIEVVEDYGDNRLTLSACHPKWSAAQRIIVWATLVGEPSPTIARPEDRRTVELEVTQPTLPAETSTSATTPAPTTPAPPTDPNTATTATGVTTDSGDEDNGGVSNGTGVTKPRSNGAAGPAGVGRVAADANQLAGDDGAWPEAVAWGLATVVALALACLMARRLDQRRGVRPWRGRLVYLAASPLCLGLLFLCFTYVDRLLPAY